MQYVFWQAFLLTLLLETPIYCWFYKKYDWRKIAALSLIINAITLPFVWFVFFPAIPDYAQFFISSELYAFGAEAVILAEVLKKGGWGTALTASAFANAVSAGAGLFIGFVL